MKATWGVALSLVLVACGDTVVEDGTGGQGGSGASGGSGATGSGVGASGSGASGSSATGGTGPTACDDHADCGPEGVCLFASGTCAAACDGFCASCGAGSICNECASSSCPACADCLAACVPTPAGACDDDDPCPAGELCIWQTQQCAPSCTANAGCADPSLACVDCATGSCCGCENCVSACMPAGR